MNVQWAEIEDSGAANEADAESEEDLQEKEDLYREEWILDRYLDWLDRMGTDLEVDFDD